jgi:hypothetical protein
MIFRQLIYCGVVGLCLVADTPSCAAQGEETANAASLAERDIRMRILNTVLDQLWNVMDPSEQAILQEVDVRVPMDYDITRVIAYRQDGRVIEISFGFFGLMNALCRDYVLASYYAEQDPNAPHIYENYVDHINSVIDRNDRAIGQDRIELPSFAEFAGIPPEIEAEIMSQGDAEYFSGTLALTAIAFVVAHEVGHHVLGHLDAPPASPAESRVHEAEADRYAVELAVRARMPPFGVIPALAIFVAAEEEHADPAATHPPAGCRILDALVATIDLLAGDEATVYLFENDQGMLPGGDKYQSLVGLKSENCS